MDMIIILVNSQLTQMINDILYFPPTKSGDKSFSFRDTGSAMLRINHSESNAATLVLGK